MSTFYPKLLYTIVVCIITESDSNILLLTRFDPALLAYMYNMYKYLKYLKSLSHESPFFLPV